MSRFLERRFRAQDGLLLYARDYGPPLSPAVPVLCLPGLTRNSKDFHALATRLSTTRRVLCPDYRGRGRSAYDPAWRNYQPRTYLDDLRHLLALAQVGRAVVIGTSMGGLLAAGLACLLPTAVAGVVMNDSGPALDRAGLARIYAYVGRDRPQPDLDGAAAHLRALFPNLSIADDAGWRAMADSTFRPGEDGRLHFDWDVNLARPLAPGRARLPDLWGVFQALGRVPTVAIRGALSDVLSAATFERMAEVKPDLVRLTIPGVGHAPSLAEPPAAAAIEALLAGLDGG